MAYPLPGALVPSNVTWILENVSRSGGVSITGSEQVVQSDAGRWRASLDITCNGVSQHKREDKILALRSFVGQMQGRVNTVLLPVFDGYRPRDNQGRMLSGVDVASLSDTWLFEHWGFGQDDLTQATLAANASLGATQISINVLEGQGPRPGNYFGIGDRLYLAHTTWQVDVDGPTFIRFAPRLRAAATAGARVILDRPHCEMRFASDDVGALELQMRRWGSVTLDFVEAI